MGLTAAKETSLRSGASGPEAEDLDVAGAEGQEGSPLKAWGHSILQTIQSPCLQMAVGQSWQFGKLLRMVQMRDRKGWPSLTVCLRNRQVKVLMDLKVPGRILWKSGQQKTGLKISLKQRYSLLHLLQQRTMSHLGTALIWWPCSTSLLLPPKPPKSTPLKHPSSRALAKPLSSQILSTTIRWHQGLQTPLLPAHILLRVCHPSLAQDLESCLNQTW